MAGVRRSWSRAQKRLIVEEAFRPGASAADVARRHGLNANQVFNWRRTMLARSPSPEASGGSSALLPPDEVGVTAAAGFLPVGVIGPLENDGASRECRAAPAAIASPSAMPARPATSAEVERPGMIEIDLADGTRLRVDAFVNERALRRVLSVLKSTT